MKLWLTIKMFNFTQHTMKENIEIYSRHNEGKLVVTERF